MSDIQYNMMVNGWGLNMLWKEVKAKNNKQS
jgi:hypothetical protein